MGVYEQISIHALLAESDTKLTVADVYKEAFLSTLSLRRATVVAYFLAPHVIFLSTLSLRRATLPISAHCFDGRISIHALLAESDLLKCVLPWMTSNFYPRSPCGERQLEVLYADGPAIFLSTLSLRRATIIPICMCVTAPISIHALLAESDSWCKRKEKKA